MPTIPRILIIDDDEDDYYLTADLLREAYGPAAAPDWIDTWESGLTAVITGGYDAYFVDYSLGAKNGLELVQEAISRGCAAPLILLTSQDNHDVDVRAMSAGATDYLIKGKATADQLARAVRYGINQKRIEGRLAALALEDTLTGLPNRALFETRLADSIAQARRGERTVAVMLLDLDNFKSVNDSLGHPVGDLLLKGVAERLLAAARETDTVARLSGDEFAIIATSLHNEGGATRLAARIVEEIGRPFEINGKKITTGASIGITIVGRDPDGAESLLGNADLALYQAKDNGGSNFCFHDRAMDAREQATRSLEIELRVALEMEELALYFQPMFDIASSNVVGAEALLRWNHPRLGMIQPEEFLPVAENTGLILPLGAWVFAQACAQVAKWREAGLPPFPIALRVHDQLIQRGELLHIVSSAINDSSIPPDSLNLEISEHEVSRNPDTVGEIINQLHQIGVRVSIDNFGASQSSLSPLASLPIQRAKLHAGLLRKDASSAIAKSVVGLGKSLGLTIAAAGTAAKSDLTHLRQYGCDEGQGDWFSPPLTAGQFIRWYQENGKKLVACA